MASSYKTLQGDTWDSIAYGLWGRENLMHLLILANQEYADVLIFPAGTVLVVPDVETSTMAGNLPPWMTE